MNVKVYGIPVRVDWLIKLVIDTLEKAVKQLVDGSKLSLEERKIVRTAYYLIQEWGKWYAAQTDTDADDQVMEAAASVCADLASEGNFELPTVPVLDEVEPSDVQ